MKSSLKFKLLKKDNISYLVQGAGGVVLYLGIFIGGLIVAMFIIQFVFGFSDLNMARIKFLLGTYFFLSLFTVFIVVALRLIAINKLKIRNPEKYHQFLNAGEQEKHEIIGKIV